MTTNERKFNFGPIARTDASNTHDTFNLASLPIHIMLDALMAATSRDEFVAWLWHDLFKPTFYWQLNNRGEFNWNHVPGYVGSPFELAEATFANSAVTNVPLGLVGTHHSGRALSGRAHFTILEQDIISEQVEQVNLGAASVYIQLAFIVEPALSSAVVRAVIAESFVEAVTKEVAAALHTTLASKPPNFQRVRFEFQTQNGLHFSNPPTNTEIWSQIGQQYDVRPTGDELIMHHITPVNASNNFSTEILVELTGSALSPEQMTNTLGLAELLIVYQDDRTVVMTVPQPAIYPINIAALTTKTKALAEHKLHTLDVLIMDKGTDLLAVAFASQIEIREVPDRLPIPPSPHVDRNRPHPRPFEPVIAYPGEQLSHAASHGQQCRVCGSAFTSNLSPKNDWPGRDFTDPEYVGAGNDICPLCRIYTLNTHKSRTPDEKQRGITSDRKALRGSFALILPTSHFDVRDRDCRLVERPPLDIGGRFDLTTRPLQRVTVTQQEFALFNQMSRRVIASLWRQIESVAVLPLPYLGGILLTHREAEQVRKVLPALRGLFTPITLLAYPFEAKVMPGVEVALDVVLTDFKQHHTKHTYLKSRANVVPIHPDSRLFVLADSKLQIEINRDWFAAYDQLASLTQGMSVSQRDEWLRRIAGGNDIVTAYFESAQTHLLKRRDTAPNADRIALSATGDFVTKFCGDDLSIGWAEYERKTNEIRAILDRYPMLPQLFSAMTERKETKDDHGNTSNAGEEADGSSAGRGARRHRQSNTTKRPRSRR